MSSRKDNFLLNPRIWHHDTLHYHDQSGGIVDSFSFHPLKKRHHISNWDTSIRNQYPLTSDSLQKFDCKECSEIDLNLLVISFTQKHVGEQKTLMAGYATEQHILSIFINVICSIQYHDQPSKTEALTPLQAPLITNSYRISTTSSILTPKE